MVEDMEVNKEEFNKEVNKEDTMEGWEKMEALQMVEEGRRLKEAQAQLSLQQVEVQTTRFIHIFMLHQKLHSKTLLHHFRKC